MAWMTPFEAVTFAVTTRAPPTKTLPRRTRIASRWPFSVFTKRRFGSLAAVSLPSATATKYDAGMASGTTWQAQTRATDAKDNTSAWVAGATKGASIQQQTTSAATWSGVFQGPARSAVASGSATAASDSATMLGAVRSNPAKQRPGRAREVVAGAVFVGPWAPVAAGDYGVGPNHVLPTGGSARRSSPLSVRDFQRRSSRVTLTRRGLARLTEGVVRVAMAEGFRGHAQSVLTRFEGEK